MLSRDQREDLAVRAATLDERLSGLYEPLPALRANTDAAALRLAAWCRSAASGDWRLFAKRLQRDGLTMESIMPRLSAIQLTPGALLPIWVDDATWILPAMVGDVDPGDAELIRSAGAAQPFELLFIGLVIEAARRRDAALPSGALARVLPAAHHAMTHQLLVSATQLCAMAVYEHFIACRNNWQKNEADLFNHGDLSSTRYYDRFVEEMRLAGLRRLFETKPVLLRLLASVTRQWIDATAEFLQRLDADSDTIARELLDQTISSEVATVEMGLSDLHKLGRSVYIVRFTNGRAIVYKPKDMAVDVAWVKLISWLNEKNAPIDLRAIRVVSRAGYGWSEFIANGDCTDRGAGSRFFQRAGALLCLFHLLVGTDMHKENMIATGEYPVPIDLEMLLQAQDPALATGEPAMKALETAQKKLHNSVLTTGLLPSFIRTPETALLALGGLNGNKTRKPPEIAWLQINTDAMIPSQSLGAVNQNNNLPRVDSSIIEITDFVNDLLEGCVSYFRFILSLKSELVADEGPLKAFAGVAIRRVLKPTRFYWLLLQRLRNHREMHDGAKWSSHLDFVSRLANWDKDSEALWPLLAAERSSLADLNVPFFIHAADGDHVSDGNGTTAVASGLFPALEAARKRIAELNDVEIDWQIEVIRLATIKGSFVDPIITEVRTSLPSVQVENSMELDDAVAKDWAGRIAERLAARAIREGNSAAWVGLDPLADGGGWQLVVLGNDLYGGAPGVALFLAAHARVTGSESSRDLSLAGLAAIRHYLSSNGAGHFARVMGIGGANGLGSLIYTFVSISQLLNDRRLTDEALSVAHLLSDDIIASDKIYDIIGGAAGCILGLLKLHRATYDAYTLNRAVACRQHLLSHRLTEGEGKGLWHHLEQRPLAGFSHGAAGFAYALSALAKSSGVEAFSAAAQDCLAYERALFSPKRGNWPDLRDLGADKKPHWPCQWCHGAGGIGLARLGISRFGIGDDDVISDIRVAVKAVRGLAASPLDALCCGNLGNAELLMEAARTLGQDGLTIEASARICNVLIAAEKVGHFGWDVGGDNENLGFFRGLSGVGYTLLRCLAPGTIPNVLIWE